MGRLPGRAQAAVFELPAVGGRPGASSHKKSKRSSPAAQPTSKSVLPGIDKNQTTVNDPTIATEFITNQPETRMDKALPAIDTIASSAHEDTAPGFA